jgi:hypothetical protein
VKIALPRPTHGVAHGDVDGIRLKGFAVVFRFAIIRSDDNGVAMLIRN